MLDSQGYNVAHIQKSSPKAGDDFIFAEIFKFRTSAGVKYIVRAELYEHNTFVVKYYAAIHKKLENKYNLLTNKHKAIKIFITCASILPILLKKYPDFSFAFNGSRMIDLASNKIESYNQNQRFRIYSFIADAMIGRETFEHYAFPEMSSYLLINKKSCSDTDLMKENIKNMFLNTFNFDNQI